MIQAAELIKSVATRVNDLAARYGGEEFAIILPNTDHGGAEEIANHLIEQKRIFFLNTSM